MSRFTIDFVRTEKAISSIDIIQSVLEGPTPEETATTDETEPGGNLVPVPDVPTPGTGSLS